MDENQIIRQINKIDESSNQMVGVILETLLNDKLLS
jgi:hypothetical protein